MLFRRDIPLHAYSWVCRLYEARAEDKGFVIEAFRGSSKTSTITIAFLAFRIGLSPHDSFLVLQATGAAARVTCRQVADLIEHNAGWRVAFPTVVPDKKLSWSMSRGFEVKRTDMDYTSWRQLCAETKGRDPSLIGLGYRSSFVVGLHPTGMLLADDIHNETNTRSVKEMEKAVAIVISNILPTLNPNSWKIFIGTPWRQGDILQYLKATQTYASISTPIYTEASAPTSDSGESPPSVIASRPNAMRPSRSNLPDDSSPTSDFSPRTSDFASASNPDSGEALPETTPTSSFRARASSAAFSGAARRGIPDAPIEKSPRPESNQSPSSVGAQHAALDQNLVISNEGAARGVIPTVLTERTSQKESEQPLPSPDLRERASQPQAGEGEGRSINLELTWPSRFPLHVIENYRLMLGEREFARMYLLDLSAAEGIHLKAEWLQKVDSMNIQPSWPVVMGVDYASTADKQRDNDRDYFAVAIGRAQPSGSGIILIDGYRGHLSQAEAQAKLLELVSFYPNTEVIGIESVGKGEEFYHSLSSHPSLPIVSMNPGGQGKGPRFQNAMAPLFERGWARITDAESTFMHAFRKEWLRWPWGDHDDTLDATYWMLRAGQYHLPPAARTRKVESPFADLGRN